MPDEFISEKIKVELSEENLREPIFFIWRGEKYIIQKIINQWQDWTLGGIPAPKRGAWRQRRHRNYYRILTNNNEQFDIYYDRGAKTPVWILASRSNSGF